MNFVFLLSALCASEDWLEEHVLFGNHEPQTIPSDNDASDNDESDNMSEGEFEALISSGLMEEINDVPAPINVDSPERSISLTTQSTPLPITNQGTRTQSLSQEEINVEDFFNNITNNITRKKPHKKRSSSSLLGKNCVYN